MHEVAAARPPERRHLIGAMLLVVAIVLLGAALIGGSYILTLHTAKVTAQRTAQRTATEIATAIEQARATALAASQAAENRSKLSTCAALYGLAEIKGSHTATATYGEHLQAGILRVYEASGCPRLLREYGDPY